MKLRTLRILLLLAMAIALFGAGCAKQAEAPADAPAAEPAQTQTAPAAEPAPSEEAAQPGIEEDDCPVYTTLKEYSAAVQRFVEDTGYVFETTSSTTKSTLYTILDGAEDLALLRVYTDEAGNIDHFFLKYSLSWAQSAGDFAFVLRLNKLCTKSALAGMTNAQYDSMAAAVGLADADGMTAYATGEAEFASDVEWTLTKNTGTLKTLRWEDETGSCELGFYIMAKDDDEPNYFAFTVTPAKQA